MTTPRPALAIIATAAVAGAIYLVATAPDTLLLPNEFEFESIIPAPDLEKWLEDSENEVDRRQPLVPGTRKRIRWYEEAGDSVTDWSIVYLHGFSATRQEIAPVVDMVADELGANAFETRLAGHGHVEGALAGMSAEQWLDDAIEALAVGSAIGERILLMGTSTGATLALALVGHPAFEAVGAMVLQSPNFGPADTSADLLTWPGGLQLAYLFAGTTRSWTPANEAQGTFWTTSYPMNAAVEMMRLVDLVRNRLPLNAGVPMLTLYSPNDTVIHVGRLVDALAQIEAQRTEVIRIERGDASNHVLAGDILAPENNRTVVDGIVGFVQQLPP